MTIEEAKDYYKSFDCEVLTSNPQNEAEMQKFSCRFRSNTLEYYFKSQAWNDDRSGETRIYVIKEPLNREIVLFFSLKCGTLFTTYDLDDRYNELDNISKSFVNDLIEVRIQKDTDKLYQLIETNVI